MQPPFPRENVSKGLVTISTEDYTMVNILLLEGTEI